MKEIKENGTGLIIKGYTSTWCVVDTDSYEGKVLFELECEECHNPNEHLIVDQDGTVLVENCKNGFDDYYELM